MANTMFENFYLSNEIEDQFRSHLDLQRFCTVDDTLSGEAGMERKINVYRATDGTERLARGVGNSKSIEVGFSGRDYKILLAQNRFQYYDEEAMADPMLVPVGTGYMATDLFHRVNADVFDEFNNAPLTVVTSALDFDAFVDAAAMLNSEHLEEESVFGLIHPADMAKLRKGLKEDLKYAESFARQGYVGTVGGIDLFVKKDAEAGKVIIATRDAVTLFHKRGTEVEQEREGNTRKNTIYARKYYLAALTDESKAVKLLVGSAAVTGDTTVTASKTYYAPSGVGFVKITPEGTENPKTKGWYEITAS